MRIGVDADVLSRYEVRGIGRTAIDLYRSVAALRPEWELLLFHQVGSLDVYFDGVPNVRPVKIDIPGDRWRGSLNLWLHVRLPVALMRHRVDVFHSHAGTTPRFAGRPIVVTIHDLTPMDFAATRPDVIRWVQNIRRSAKTAERIVCCSNYVKKDLVSRLRVPAEKIDVVYWASNDHYVPLKGSQEQVAILTKLGVRSPRPFILHFGSINPHKNTLRILEAWARQPKSVLERFQLIVSGVEESGLKAFREVVRNLGIQDDCELIGSVPDGERASLLSAATALAYPSLSEGFGMPLVDALKAGIPVLTSDSTCLPEIAGGAALLVDPRSTESVSRGMSRILLDDATRRELVMAGFARSKDFSWHQAATSFAKVLLSAAQRDRAPSR